MMDESQALCLPYQQFSFWLKALLYLGFAAGLLRGVDTGISPFEPQREGVFPASPPDSAGNARPSLRWGGPFGPAQDRLISAYRGAHHRKMTITDVQVILLTD